MATPSRAQFTQIVEAQGDRPLAIPVYREILADLDTPVSAFLKVGDANYAFLLESVEGGEQWARYSFIGLDPAFVVRATGRRCELIRDGWVAETAERDDPLTWLEEQLHRYAPVPIPGLPRFAGGAVGWLGFDAVRWWEPLGERHPGDGPDVDQAPTMVFAAPRTLLIFDNLRHRILVVQVVLTRPGQDPSVVYEGALQRIDRTIQQLKGPLPPLQAAEAGDARLTPQTPRPQFEAAVERIKEYIRSGDCIQVVLSQRFELGYGGHPFDLYRALRAVNPSPYMFCLRFPEQLVVGASPEVMVRVEDGQALVCPIAGTRHRGTNEAEDRALAEELLADPKERAEHVMLVDLGRNDLGRVAAAGTVEVVDLMRIERYSHVMHIVSEIHCQLAEGRTGYDAVRATFPAGTLSGAPKVRAMQIIDELEPNGRGLYGGSVGWFGFDGALDLCIAIRTAWLRGGRWHLQVGAGVVADSDPSLEYEETMNKAGGVLRALDLAREGL